MGPWAGWMIVDRRWDPEHWLKDTQSTHQNGVLSVCLIGLNWLEVTAAPSVLAQPGGSVWYSQTSVSLRGRVTPPLRALHLSLISFFPSVYWKLSFSHILPLSHTLGSFLSLSLKPSLFFSHSPLFPLFTLSLHFFICLFHSLHRLLRRLPLLFHHLITFSPSLCPSPAVCQPVHRSCTQLALLTLQN